MYNKPTSLNYRDAGFNKFFTRSINSSNTTDTLQQISNTAGNKSLNFDQYSTSGSLGDKIQVGGITIDGSGERITVNRDGIEVSAFGNTNGEYGLIFNNASGKMVSKTDGATDRKYTRDGINYYQNGELPDGDYGTIITKPGIDIDAVF
jgi:hypothetical protein